MNPDVWDEAIEQLHNYIEDSGIAAKTIIEQLPKSYSIKSMHDSFDKGWVTGFHRCMAEVQRIVEQEQKRVTKS